MAAARAFVMLIISTTLLLGLAASASAAQPDEPSLLLILDASGSMQAQFGKDTRIVAAKQALHQLIDALPTDSRVGLRVYGHRVPNSDRRRGCRDTELVVPVRVLNRRVLHERIDRIRSRGFTPIGASLRAAGSDLRGSRNKNIVLVSDGIDTCVPPPCPVARRLGEGGTRIDVIGLAVGRAARKQLRCIAKEGGGAYVDVDNARSLADRIRRFSLRPFRAFTVQGKRVEGAATPDRSPLLEPGTYATAITGRGAWFAVDVAAGQRLAVSATAAAGRDTPPLRFAQLGLRLHDPQIVSPLNARSLVAFDGVAPATAAADIEAAGPALEASGSSEEARHYVYVGLVGPDNVRALYPVELNVEVAGEPARPVRDEEGGSPLRIALGAAAVLVGAAAGFGLQSSAASVFRR